MFYPYLTGLVRSNHRYYTLRNRDWKWACFLHINASSYKCEHAHSSEFSSWYVRWLHVHPASLLVFKPEVDKRYSYFVYNHGSHVNENYDWADPLFKTCWATKPKVLCNKLMCICRTRSGYKSKLATSRVLWELEMYIVAWIDRKRQMKHGVKENRSTDLW